MNNSLLLRMCDLNPSEVHLLWHPFLIDKSNRQLAERLIGAQVIEYGGDRYVATRKGMSWREGVGCYDWDENTHWSGCELSKIVFPASVHVRIQNCLRAQDVRTLAELRGIPKGVMLRWRNFGAKCVRAIADVTRVFDDNGPKPIAQSRRKHKLERDIIVEIAYSGETGNVLAARHGISRQMVSLIKRGRSHVAVTNLRNPV